METGRLIDVNQRVCEFFGWQPAEVIGKTVGELGIWADPAEQRPVLDAVHATGAIRDREVRLCRRNGEVRDVLLSVEQAGLPRETERAMMIVFTDVTDRKKAENALQESEIRFSSFMEHSPIAGWIVDGEGRFRYLSPGYYRMFAVGDADLTGKLISEVYEPAVAERYLANNRMALEERRVVETVEKCLRPDGSTGEFMAVKFPIDGPDGVPLRGIEVDITERKKLEQQFLRSQRMESIGTLAGGIAHDLNNVLGPIIMSIDLLKMKFTDPGSLELLSLISSSAQRGAAMVSQVLSFARGVDGHKVHLQVKHVLRDIEKIANEIFPKNIQIRTKIPLELWTVEADPTQLHQVLLNLCVNARDAMPDGGRLTLTAENATIDAQYAGLEKEARPGPYVLLQVEDTGTGIAPEIIEQIFDPFFTTKEIGKGTGLGLSTTLAIVKSHGGFIRVYSELGAGTKFKLYLPAKTDVSPDAEADVEVELPRGRGELILVVDDEATVREITKETLEAFGYRVIVAADGAEAVGLLAERKKEVAAVLTDMTMPIMDGPATIQVMRRLSPQLPIVATSGLTANGHFARLGSLGVKHFLSKPYTAETLLQTMRQVLTPAPAIGCRF
ncbi:MAG: PAS domain S-box protein [Chthoniobacter sp.]